MRSRAGGRVVRGSSVLVGIVARTPGFAVTLDTWDPRLTPGNCRWSPGEAGLLDTVDAQTDCERRSLCCSEFAVVVLRDDRPTSCNPASPGDHLQLPGVSRGSHAPRGRRTPDFSCASRRSRAIAGRCIVDVQHLTAEQHLDVAELKLSIVDVTCTDASGRRFVVETQVLKVEGFEKRVVYNASKAYAMQLRNAEEYPALCDVFGVTICNFNLCERSRRSWWHAAAGGCSIDRRWIGRTRPDGLPPR